MSEKNDRIFGIDLGTTYSSIAVSDAYGKAVIIPNSDYKPMTPSVVYFGGDSVMVGQAAKEVSKLSPENAVDFVKRSIGEDGFVFEFQDKTYRTEEISAYIIKKLVQDAEAYLDEEITDIVITCPAYFGINEREATRKAGEIAGYNVRQIINEPTAAAIAYGTVTSKEEKNVLVYDLGGGTFDITMIEISPEAVEVISVGGDHNLGGKNWDDRIVTYVAEAFTQVTKINEDILEDPDTWYDLQLSAEKAKILLSDQDKAPIIVTYAGERVKVELTREKFEAITQALVERTIAFTHDMLKEARKKGHETFDEIVLVGGSVRMPQIAGRIADEFRVKPKIFDPEQAVAKGAAIFGAKLAVNNELVQRIAKKKNKPVIPSDNNLGMSLHKLTGGNVSPKEFDTAVKEMAREKELSLPEFKESMISVTDVASKSFGVAVKNYGKDEMVYNLILKNTPVPGNLTKTFYTGTDNQKNVLIRIMENNLADQNVPADDSIEIGNAILTLPPKIPNDSPIEITFTLNAEGRLIITALEKTDSKSVDVVIDTESVISGEELEEARERCQSLYVK